MLAMWGIADVNARLQEDLDACNQVIVHGKEKLECCYVYHHIISVRRMACGALHNRRHLVLSWRGSRTRLVPGRRVDIRW